MRSKRSILHGILRTTQLLNNQTLRTRRFYEQLSEHLYEQRNDINITRSTSEADEMYVAQASLASISTHLCLSLDSLAIPIFKYCFNSLRKQKKGELNVRRHLLENDKATCEEFLALFQIWILRHSRNSIKL